MYSDYTDFKDGNWRGWQSHQESEVDLATTDPHHLEYPKQTATKVLLRKVVDIKPGKLYKIGASLRLRDSQYTAQQVFFTVDQNPLETWTVDSDEWTDFYTTFVGDRDSPELALVYVSAPAAAGLYIDNLLISEMDLTDFAGKTLQNWELRSDYPEEYKAIAPEGDVLYIHTYDQPADHRGVFLTKPCVHLVAGASYKFEMRASAQIALAPAVLEVKFISAKGIDIQVLKTEEINEPYSWKTYSATFIATDDTGKFTVENHTQTASGNDFYISKLAYYRVIPEHDA